MAQIESGQRMSLSLFDQKLGRIQKGSAFQHLPSLRVRVGAQVALQRCPILRTNMVSLPYYSFHPEKGDISTLQSRGHFYFALTGNRIITRR